MSDPQDSKTKHVRHILSLSGGKDSTALAIYMRDRVENMEYVFCDTEKELPETYEYLLKIEAYLGRKIVILKHDGRDFDHHLKMRRGYLPSPRMRWCTEQLKLRPFERYVGDDPTINYIGIRADENRKGYISHRPNIQPKYPFIEDSITKEDVIRILEESGLGLPAYYKWRSRSGCYFCFFQQRNEWVGLLENHPELFEEAIQYEKEDPTTKKRFTWSQRESLRDLATPERIADIKAEHAQRMEEAQKNCSNQSLLNVFDGKDNSEQACLICEL